MRKLKLFCTIFIFLLLSIQGTVCYAKKQPQSTDAKGYVGTLPDLTSKYEIKDAQTESTPETRPAKDFNTESDIKPIPKDDPAFVNIILKSDKTSQYVNDLNEFIPILEQLFDMIENKENVQVFNAKVYFFNKNADFFRDKYANKPESRFISYKRLLDLSLHAHSIALLRTEAQKYNPYLAYGNEGYIYNPNSITEQLDYLKTEIEQTILILKESN